MKCISFVKAIILVTLQLAREIDTHDVIRQARTRNTELVAGELLKFQLLQLKAGWLVLDILANDASYWLLDQL
jgi:hypothetical protein